MAQSAFRQALLVRVFERREDRVPAGEIEADLRCGHLDSIVRSDLTVGPDEAALFDDPDVVLLAADRASQRRHHGVRDLVDRDGRVLAVDVEVDRAAVHRAGLGKGGVEDLEERVALLASPDAAESVVLLVGLGIDVGVPAPAAVMDGARPPERPDDLRSGEIEPVASAVVDSVGEEGLAVPFRGVRDAFEVAGAAGFAAAELEVCAPKLPIGHSTEPARARTDARLSRTRRTGRACSLRRSRRRARPEP